MKILQYKPNKIICELNSNDESFKYFEKLYSKDYPSDFSWKVKLLLTEINKKLNYTMYKPDLPSLPAFFNKRNFIEASVPTDWYDQGIVFRFLFRV